MRRSGAGQKSRTEPEAPHTTQNRGAQSSWWRSATGYTLPPNKAAKIEPSNPRLHAGYMNETLDGGLSIPGCNACFLPLAESCDRPLASARSSGSRPAHAQPCIEAARRRLTQATIGTATFPPRDAPVATTRTCTVSTRAPKAKSRPEAALRIRGSRRSIRTSHAGLW
jgi:hypothetical protein